MENFSNEIWRDIPEYEGFYQASNWGRVKSLMRTTTKGVILKSANSFGYRRVVLSKNGIHKNFMVHRLVWMAFNGPIPEGMQINHNNEDKSDNRLINLSLMTATENINWGTAIKRIKEKQTNGKLSKVVLQFDLDGNFIKEYPSTQEIERITGYDSGNIRCCLRNLRNQKTAYGYVWKYKEVVN